KRSNMRRLRGVSMGSASAWLPSRRSTGTHSGACSIRRRGQVRSTAGSGTRSCAGRYRWYGMALGRWGFHAGAVAGTGPLGVRSVGKGVGTEKWSVTTVIGAPSIGRGPVAAGPVAGPPPVRSTTGKARAPRRGAGRSGPAAAAEKETLVDHHAEYTSRHRLLRQPDR